MNRIFKHQLFLSENNIKMDTLPQLLQKRIRGFEEFVEDYPHTLDEDQELLKDKIIQLDLELEEDLYELYEQDLENNEHFEEDKEKDETTRSPKQKSKKATATKEVKKVRTVQKPLSDEDILDQLWKINRRENLKRSFLKESGIKTPIRGWNIAIGDYRLRRTALFSYTYQLIKQE